MKKVLLLQPPQPGGKGFELDWLPSNITGLAGVLEANGYESNVGVIDLIGFSQFQGVEELLKERAPDVVGITILADARMNACRLARIVRSTCPDATIVVGGIYVTLMYEQILKNWDVDVAVIGEGDVTLVELMKALEKDGPLEKIEGIAFKRGEEVIKTPPRPYIKDLDTLPLPAYHLIYPEPGKNTHGKGCAFDVVLGRGCPFNCLFCSTQSQWGTSYRNFGIKKVGDLIEHLLTSFQTDFAILNDDTFALNEKRVIGICQEILDRGLKFEWFARTRVDLISKTGLEWMKKAGCKTISYGVESGSPKVLKNINKKISLDQIEQAFALTSEVGINSDATIMIGNPGEDASTVRETEALLDKIRPGHLDVGLPLLYPGTGLYALAKTEGLIDDDYWSSDLLTPIYTGAMPLPQLWIYKWRMLYRQSIRQKEVKRFIRLFKEEITFVRFKAILKILFFDLPGKIGRKSSPQA